MLMQAPKACSLSDKMLSGIRYCEENIMMGTTYRRCLDL